MSLRTGFSPVILPQSALVIPATASAGVYHTQLTNLSSGTYIGNYNYAIVANTGGANFVAGGYIALTYYNYYGAPGVPSPIMLTMMECPVLVAGEEFRGTNCFSFTGFSPKSHKSFYGIFPLAPRAIKREGEGLTATRAMRHDRASITR